MEQVQAQNDKLKEITDKLEQGIKELFESEKYMNYLKVMSKFHNYSVNNSLLIAMQKPEATMVAGFNAWQANFKRNVKKGERGIRIIAPAPYKKITEIDKVDPKTQLPIIGADGKPVKEKAQVIVPAYKVTTVFDVSQTYGEELPTITTELTGEVGEYERFMGAVKEVSPVPIEICSINNGANGYYHLEDKRIAIREGMSQMQTLKTAIHELSHAVLHDRDTGIEKDKLQDRKTKEVEAESVAYTVCQHFGIDTSDYSFGYVAGWSSGKELEELKNSMNTIRSTASRIIKGIEAKMQEEVQEKEKEEEKECSIGFYAAECSEFHSLGAFHEFDTLQEATKKYLEMREAGAWGVPEIGAIYYNENDALYDGAEIPLLTGNKLNIDTVNKVDKFRECGEIQLALKSLKEAFQFARTSERERTEQLHRSRRR